MWLAAWALLAGDEPAKKFPEPFDDQAATIPLPPPAEAVKRWQLPPGYRATVFAAEPDVRNPIALDIDSRGRLWVCECYSYGDAKTQFAKELRDRIVIFEDTDGDGIHDKRTVFWDQGFRLTSVCMAAGGVYALCPPQLLFIPDRNGDDKPDGPPQVVLDGFTVSAASRHTFANGLKWGPDGWLYGRQGISQDVRIGKPGAPEVDRLHLRAGLWRYHPRRGVVEAVCHGTTNPWGHDWDEHGELFFINTVIGHLWHAAPGAKFERMFGADVDPYAYKLIPQTADHYHWDASTPWTASRLNSPSTDTAGGGHAHIGMMIYQGDDWPDSERGKLFTLNMHGFRINRERLERQHAGYVGKHEPDFAKMGDPWFRGIDLASGPDGGVFVLDWSDIGECHENDGVHRNSGRIYKIMHGPRREPLGDMAKLTNEQLAGEVFHKNEWRGRTARRLLSERAAAGADLAATARRLHRLDAEEPVEQLRRLWALHAIGATSRAQLLELTGGDATEHIRAWAWRLLCDLGPLSVEDRAVGVNLAKSDPSGLVLLYLASTLQTLPVAERWPLAEALAARGEFAADRAFPLMVWYGLAPAAPGDPARALKIAATTPLPHLARHLARRLTEDCLERPAPVAGVVATLAAATGERRTEILGGMVDATRGWRKAPAPPGWAELAPKLLADPATKAAAEELDALFGSGRTLGALRALVANGKADIAARRAAVEALGRQRDRADVPTLRNLLGQADVEADAVRALADIDPGTAAGWIADAYPRLAAEGRRAAVAALCSRADGAARLVAAVRKGTVANDDVSPFQIRQLKSLGDAAVEKAAGELWPQYAGRPADKAKQLAKYRAELTPAVRTAADAGHGRQVFAKSCGNCHQLYGQGALLGPNLTGADRQNLDYLLDNLLDPSAIVPPAYKTTQLELADGRRLLGVIAERGAKTLTILAPTGATTLLRSEVVAERESPLSVMPEGLLEGMPPADRAALFAYLMSKSPPAGP